MVTKAQPAVKKVGRPAKKIVVPAAKKAVTKRVPKGGAKLTSANHELEQLKAENAELKEMLGKAARSCAGAIKVMIKAKMEALHYEAISKDFDEQITDLKKKLKKAKAA